MGCIRGFNYNDKVEDLSKITDPRYVFIYIYIYIYICRDILSIVLHDVDKE